MESSKIIRLRRGPLLVLLTAACLFAAAAATPAGPTPAHRVAFFDFDRRDLDPDPLTWYIETRLRGLIPGVAVDIYSGLGDEDRAVRLLRRIEERGYDLAIVRTSDALIIAQHTLFRTPTLYTNANNPLLLGFRTLGPPGGNISGASYYIPVARHLRVYRAILPSLERPGFIFDRHNKSRKVEVPETREACAALGLRFEMEFVDDRGDLPRAAAALVERGADALVAASSGTVYENIGRFLEPANRAGVPVFSFYKAGVPEGAVAALSSDFFRMADELLLPMARRVLVEGVSPGEMPAAFLEKNKLFVNREQARRFGLRIPDALAREHDVVYIEPDDGGPPAAAPATVPRADGRPPGGEEPHADRGG